MMKRNGTRKNNLTRLVSRTWNAALDDTFLFLFKNFSRERVKIYELRGNTVKQLSSSDETKHLPFPLLLLDGFPLTGEKSFRHGV